MISNLLLYFVTLQSAHLDRQLDCLYCKSRQLEPCPNAVSLFIFKELEDVGEFIKFRNEVMENVVKCRAYKSSIKIMAQLIKTQHAAIRKVKMLHNVI